LDRYTLSGTEQGVKAPGRSTQPEPDPRRLTRAELAAFLRGRATVSVPFAGACYGASRSASYGAVKNGSLRALRLGHKLRVPASWLEAELGLEDAE
jgi:hypothetical protein